ncbi:MULTISPECIES: hypothetical protein [unclassified Bradyrhizobium]|uniref:hypothetical protein n=1 Tax=unclassified Bradyrhizobium TaxID=2631580 RepID=UPI00247A350A|nr:MULTISPECIES: hypothetical protein [unclassified Bradyrhizobium]WGS18526.1 hypothetical protein MTX22_28725 [Bradyrhizobium sp. ISRA463]WGS25351.1 hypothetical protein MTX19_26325 [Bradyrhizobium sp. ISRA464]
MPITRKPIEIPPEVARQFADEDTADAWFKEHDPEGVAFALGAGTGIVADVYHC